MIGSFEAKFSLIGGFEAILSVIGYPGLPALINHKFKFWCNPWDVQVELSRGFRFDQSGPTSGHVNPDIV